MKELTTLMLDLHRHEVRVQVEHERLVRALAARQRLLRQQERVRKSLERTSALLVSAQHRTT